MKKTTTLTLTALALSAAFTLNACGNAAASAAPSVPAQEAAAPAPTALPTAAPAPLPAGTVLLSVNPEIEMEYDGGGNVMALNGLNDDGRAVLNAYSGYEGRPCAEVVGELVGQIDAGGYFDETIGGQEKNIVLRLESGSGAPAGFLNGLADAARSTVETRQIGSQTMTLDGDDMDDAYAAQGYISAGAAEQLLAAQLARDDLQFVERDYDLEDGDYEIAFVADGIEYEFEVDARTGKVTEMEAEGRESWEDHWDDDWDDDLDDQYDDLDDQYDDLDDQYDDLDDQSRRLGTTSTTTWTTSTTTWTTSTTTGMTSMTTGTTSTTTWTTSMTTGTTRTMTGMTSMTIGMSSMTTGTTRTMIGTTRTTTGTTMTTIGMTTMTVTTTEPSLPYFLHSAG